MNTKRKATDISEDPPKYLIIEEHEEGCNVYVLHRELSEFEKIVLDNINGCTPKEGNNSHEMLLMLLHPEIFDELWNAEAKSEATGQKNPWENVSEDDDSMDKVYNKLLNIPKSKRGTLKPDVKHWKLNEKRPEDCRGPYTKVFYFSEID